jgi:anti-sigma B factor antagonist
MSEGNIGYIFCSNCGAQNPEKNNFCSRCGMRIIRVPAAGTTGLECGNCQHLNDGSASFCVRCSHPLPKDANVREIEDVAVVEFMRENIDFENHREFVNVLNKVIKKRIIIDLSAVKWMDSTGIGMIVTFTYKTSRTKQEVKIVGVCKKIMEAIKALQVDNVLDLYGEVNEALASWGLVP